MIMSNIKELFRVIGINKSNKEINNALKKTITNIKEVSDDIGIESYINTLKNRYFIEAINEMDLDKLDIPELKKILVIKWLIKNFKLLSYKGDCDDVKTLKESETIEKDIKYMIYRNFHSYDKAYPGEIKFLYKGYKISFGPIHKRYREEFKYEIDFCFHYIIQDLEKLNIFLTSSDMPFNKEKEEEIFKYLTNKLDELIKNIKKREKKNTDIENYKKGLKNVISSIYIYEE